VPPAAHSPRRRAARHAHVDRRCPVGRALPSVRGCPRPSAPPPPGDYAVWSRPCRARASARRTRWLRRHRPREPARVPSPRRRSLRRKLRPSSLTDPLPHRPPPHRPPPHRLSLHRLSLHRLSLHRLSLHRLSLHRLSLHRLSLHRLSLHRPSLHRPPPQRPSPLRLRRQAVGPGERR